MAVPRRRRGFIGGTGGAPLGEGSADPGGRPTRGTFDVDETNVGSDICFLFTGRFRREPCPRPRWGICGPLDEEARDVDELSDGISFSGGVALAEYAGAAGGARGEAPMIEDVLDWENWNGRSYWKFGVPDRLLLRYLPEAAEGARSKFAGSDISADGRPDVGREIGTGGS